MRSEAHIGGTSVHVGDCQVWAGILYLDSDTDYREYLPNNPRRWSREDELAMLDEEAVLGWRGIFLLSLVLVSALATTTIVLG